MIERSGAIINGIAVIIVLYNRSTIYLFAAGGWVQFFILKFVLFTDFLLCYYLLV